MAEPVPILLLTLQLDTGGTERQLCEMATALDRGSFRVHVGQFRTGGMRARELAAASIPVVTLPLQSFRSPIGLVRAIVRLRAYVREHDIRLVHAFDTPGSIFAALARPFLGGAIVLSSQRTHRSLFSRLYRLGLRLSDRAVPAIVVNCLAVRQHLIEDERVPAERIRLCYNGIDVDRFSPRSRGFDRPIPHSIVIGTMCVLRPEKRLDVLIRAFARCQAGLPNLSLLVVGNGSERQKLESLARELGLGASCQFQPPVADVVPWLNKIDVFVLPSESEALSNALMEAMACSCACVASRIGGNGELITDGQTGLLFPAGDVDALTAALQTLVSRSDLRQSMGERARTRMVTDFSVTAATVQLSAIYSEWLANSK